MFFEGIEKKAEIFVDADKVNLLEDFDDDFWLRMVKSCDAQVISVIKSDRCWAFLLSESCLLVWPHKLLIVTCGATQLVQAVKFFLSYCDKSLIAHLIYQRKNEHVSSVQSSHFFDDIAMLDEFIEGKAYRFGDLHDHHNYLYHMDSVPRFVNIPQTFQLLAYQLSDKSCELFEQANQSGIDGAVIRQFMGLDKLLDGFTIDEHIFSPSGYSLNAIKGDQYLTVHVTPIVEASYVSFEANFDLSDFIPVMLETLNPRAFDVLGFNIDNIADTLKSNSYTNYLSKSLVNSQLSNGLMVHFASFVTPYENFTSAVEIGDRHSRYPSY